MTRKPPSAPVRHRRRPCGPRWPCAQPLGGSPGATRAPGIGRFGDWRHPARRCPTLHSVRDVWRGCAAQKYPCLPGDATEVSTARRCPRPCPERGRGCRRVQCAPKVPQHCPKARHGVGEASVRGQKMIEKGPRKWKKQDACENSVDQRLSTGRIAKWYARSGLENQQGFPNAHHLRHAAGGRNYMSMVLRIRPTARPSISKASPG